MTFESRSVDIPIRSPQVALRGGIRPAGYACLCSLEFGVVSYLGNAILHCVLVGRFRLLRQ